MQEQAQSSIDDLFKKIRSGDRVALGRGITLVESQQVQHLADAAELLDACAAHVPSRPAMRIAITGAPGVGKSSMIEALGKQILDAGMRLAVLAVDPSSQVSGGAILGDKTRMQTLSADPRAFVRPTSSGSHHGGVALRTHEALLLCEAAGYDVIIIETVGVGQSETRVRSLADIVLLMIAPGGGDEVQGIKRGILEIADIVVVNKADGEWQKRAQETLGQYTHALRILFDQDRMPDVLSASALTGNSIEKIWKAVRDRFGSLEEEGINTLRSRQYLELFDERMQVLVVAAWLRHPQVAEAYGKIHTELTEGSSSLRSALSGMERLVTEILGKQV